MKLKHIVYKVRPFIVVGWVLLVYVYFTFSYIQHLQEAYPILQQVRELGIIELIRRYFTP